MDPGSSPYGIAVGPDGSVYVTSFCFWYCVTEFTSEGEFVREFGWGHKLENPIPDGMFGIAKGIAVAPDGSVYVSDPRINRIQKFTSKGAFVSKWGKKGTGDGEFDWAQGVAVAPDGSVYVADSGNHRIQKFTSKGAFIGKWGKEGTGDGELSVADGFQNGVSVAPDGSVYVADSGNHRIQKFTSEGEFIRKWGKKGTGDGRFMLPGGITVGSDGSVYVADSKNSRIQKFTSEGEFVSKWGTRGTIGQGEGKFFRTDDVAVAADGSIYVTDSVRSLIQKFSPAP